MCALRNHPLWSPVSPGASNFNHPEVLCESRIQPQQERPEFRTFVIAEPAWQDTGNLFVALAAGREENTFIELTGSQRFEEGSCLLSEGSLTWGGVALVRVAWGSDSWKG
jgi:hypothetical protein